MTTPNSNPDPSSSPKSTVPEPLLLLSGSGLQPWIWDDFVAELPTNTAVGIARRPSGKDASLAEYVASALEAAPSERFTIVAHSVGAVVALGVAAAAPERVSGLVAVAGVVPALPGSFLSAMPIPNRWVLSMAMRVAGTRPPDKAIRKTLTGRLDADVADRIVEQFEAESPHLFRTAVAQGSQPIPKGYVRTAEDAEMPAGLQDRFVNALTPDWTKTLQAGHLPMLEDPAGLAAAIVDFGQLV